jgi:seryl-tRNA synthetase
MARTHAAILETYQRPDGNIDVPEVLQPYLRRPVIERPAAALTAAPPPAQPSA